MSKRFLSSFARPSVRRAGFYNGSLVLFAGLLALASVSGCGDDMGGVSSGPLDSGDADGGDPGGPADTGTRSDGGRVPIRRPPDASVDPEDDGGDEPDVNCGSVNCGLHGDCVVDAVGAPSCACDRGYIPDLGARDAEEICIEDRACVTARILDCRWNYNTAVGLQVSLQYCSGNPYSGFDIDELLVEEKGNQEFQELLPSESFASIVDHDALQQIYLVIDISNSIQQSDVLGDIANGVQNFFDSLEQMNGTYEVAVFAFDGRTYLYEFLPPTRDLGAARDRMDDLEAYPGNDPSSSNVYGAAIEGIDQLERARRLRTLVSDLGELSTGTLVLVSDGDDRASVRTLAEVQARIDSTGANIITVGLGDVANYPTLTMIGRDGSFSAQQSSLIVDTFEQIADRIRAQDESLYLIGYCTPKRAGAFTTRIGIRNVEFTRPECTFNAAQFTTSSCSPASFVRETACAASDCGGVIGCGGCPDGQCCEGGVCQAPTRLPAAAACGAEWMCGPSTSCALVTDTLRCVATATPNGELCDATNACDTGASYCAAPTPPTEPATTICMTAGGLGSACATPAECLSLHCAADPDSPTQANKECRPPAQMFDSCAGNPQACEPGSYCFMDVCQPQRNGGTCESAAECKSGNCVALPSGTKICRAVDVAGSACLFPLDL